MLWRGAYRLRGEDQRCVWVRTSSGASEMCNATLLYALLKQNHTVKRRKYHVHIKFCECLEA